ncbi:MAG: hypothetical protein CMJ89_11980 [Planctomycetes bacterium]|nr:hypothetical protein [Planctomycetota bacterium]
MSSFSARSLTRALTLIGWATACGPGTSPPPAPARLRLADVGQAELTAIQVGASERKQVWSADFKDGVVGWRSVSNPTEPAVQVQGVLVSEVLQDGKARFLRLSGKRGLAVQIVPVKAETTYVFTGEIRAQNLVPESTPFHGATFWLAELKTDESFDRIAGGDLDESIHLRHILAPAAETRDWTERKKTFRTGPLTRALLIGCALGTSEDVISGAVDFARLHLMQAPDAVLWDAQARSAAATRHGSDHADWRSRRRISADLRAELRPSIVLLPGERLRFRLRLQEEAPIFNSGLGVWREAILPGSTANCELTVRVDGHSVLESELQAPEDSLKARWHEVEVDLSGWAGKSVDLELACRGSTPAVFGAPCVRAAHQRDERPNVLLISIDMLRADHIGSYGYELETTPNLDRLALESLFFPDMHAQASYTLPATVSMFSGQFPSVHGVFRGTQAISPLRSPLIAEILGSEGYLTQGFTAGGFVSADFGLDAGFDGFTNVDPLRHEDSDFFHLLRNRCPELTRDLVAEHGFERIVGWLGDHADEPFFLFLHTYTVHDYDAPDEWLACESLGCTSTRTDYSSFLPHVDSEEVVTPEDRRHLVHRYDGSLRFVDHLLGELFAQLERLDLDDRTIIAVTSDHGEEMFERGFIQHGKTLYEELTRIPLILHIPGVPARVISKPAMTIDVTPTLLAALDLPRDDRMQGTNLLAKDLEARPVLAEINDNFAHKYALRDGLGFKLIHSPKEREVLIPSEREWELYATKSDPGETQDISETNTERFDLLRSALEERISLLQQLGRSLGLVGAADVDEQTRQQLKQLGY